MNESKPDMNKMLFMHMISMLAMTAIQQMGKLVDPATGKAEAHLEAAQATIDMLDMLEIKTRGNLDAEEAKLLKDTLMSLKMNYVESLEQKTDAGRQTPDAGPEKTNAGTEKTEDGRQTADAGPAKTENGTEKQTSNVESKPTDGADKDKTPKYHKKYE